MYNHHLGAQLAPFGLSKAKRERHRLLGQELCNSLAHFMAAGQTCREEIVGATQGSKKNSRKHLWILTSSRAVTPGSSSLLLDPILGLSSLAPALGIRR